MDDLTGEIEDIQAESAFRCLPCQLEPFLADRHRKKWLAGEMQQGAHHWLLSPWYSRTTVRSSYWRFFPFSNCQLFDQRPESLGNVPHS